MRDNDVKKINYFVRILPRDSLYIIEAVDKAAAKGIIHKNAAARKKSQLAKKLNAVS